MKHVRIALVSFGHSNVALPLGLLYLAAVAEREHCDVKVFDFGIRPTSDLHDDIAQFEPDIIGCTVLTPTVNVAARFVSRTRFDLPESIIVLGGAARLNASEGWSNLLQGQYRCGWRGGIGVQTDYRRI
jgi:hypothetical protein